MFNATFQRPDLTTFCRLDGLGLEATGQFLAPDRAVIAGSVVATDEWCRKCGGEGISRDTVTRELRAPDGDDGIRPSARCDPAPD